MCDINLPVCVFFFNFRGIKLKKAMQTIYELPIVFIVEQTRQVTESRRKNGLFYAVFVLVLHVCVPRSECGNHKTIHLNMLWDHLPKISTNFRLPSKVMPYIY